MKKNYIVGYFNPLSMNGIKSVIENSLELDMYWADSLKNELKIIEENNIDYILGWSEIAKKPLLYLYKTGKEYNERYDCDEVVYKEIDTFHSEEEAIEYISQTIYIQKVLTFGEATQLWQLGTSTLRKSQQDGRFREEETRKSGGTWLVTYEAMQRLYGKENQND